jgi:hypothetical protein
MSALHKNFEQVYPAPLVIESSHTRKCFLKSGKYNCPNYVNLVLLLKHEVTNFLISSSLLNQNKFKMIITHFTRIVGSKKCCTSVSELYDPVL